MGAVSAAPCAGLAGPSRRRRGSGSGDPGQPSEPEPTAGITGVGPARADPLGAGRRPAGGGQGNRTAAAATYRRRRRLSLGKAAAARHKAGMTTKNRMADDKPRSGAARRMSEMTQAEWESLCDGCGRCCLNKLIDEDTGETVFTNVGCRLLDAKTCRCTRLCPPAGPREGLRAADPAQREAADLAAADLRLPAGGGGRGSGLVAPAGVGRARRRCTRPASRCAAGWRRARRTCRTRGWRSIS